MQRTDKKKKMNPNTYLATSEPMISHMPAHGRGHLQKDGMLAHNSPVRKTSERFDANVILKCNDMHRQVPYKTAWSSCSMEILGLQKYNKT